MEQDNLNEEDSVSQGDLFEAELDGTAVEEEPTDVFESELSKASSEDLPEGDHDLTNNESDNQTQTTEDAAVENEVTDDESDETEVESDDQDGVESEFEIPKSFTDINRDQLGDEAKAVYDTLLKPVKEFQGDYTRKTQDIANVKKVIEHYSDDMDALAKAYNESGYNEQIGRDVTKDDIAAEAVNHLIQMQTNPEYRKANFEALAQEYSQESTTGTEGTPAEGGEVSPEVKALEAKVAQMEAVMTQSQAEQIKIQQATEFQNEFDSVQKAYPDWTSEDYDKALEIWEKGESENLSMLASAQRYAAQKEEFESNLQKQVDERARELLKSKTSAAPTSAGGKGKVAEVSTSISDDEIDLNNIDEVVANMISE